MPRGSLPVPVAALERGTPVTLADGRIGYVDGRCFGITPGGLPTLEHYGVLVRGGAGRVSARPSQVKAYVAGGGQ